MKYKKIMFMLVLVIFIFGAASVCASDVNDTVIASEDTSQLELSAGSELDADNLKTSEKNTILTQTNNDESMSGEIDSEVLGADIGTYSGLSEEIGSGGNIELIHDYYTYDSGSTIEISVDNSVIDGKGAIIDMAGSNKQAFDVSASGVIIKNLTIKNAKYNALGGAILFGRSGTVENCNFTNNSGTSSGGAVYFADTGIVTNCTFVGNTASRDGGAVYFADTGIVTNCNFINNKATGTAGEMGSSGDGGAVYFPSTGTVTNCNFTGNTASGDGGAVHFTGDGTVSNCTFVGNTAGRSGGGAVYFSDTGIVTNCNFTNNKATGGSIYGGAIRMSSGTVTNCSFTNHSANYGGAVRMGSGSVENCNFTDNTATRDGGAIYFLNTGSVINCNFTNSSATGAGGAVYFYDNSEVTNCNFIYNVAKSSTLGGGAIFFMISGNVAKCNFTDNSASFGGAVLFGGKGNISNSNFTNNSASNGGGAINMASGSVENCNFTDNKATSSSGGSIWFTGNGDVINCIFTNNSATGDGGAVYFYEGATGRIINCNFTDNKATSGDGGAIYFAENSNGNVTNCNFADNQATGDYSYGGAIYFLNNGNVAKCNFKGNSALNDAGAIYFEGSGTVTDCNFSNNIAGYGGAIDFEGSGTVTDCNFTNNAAGYCGGAIYFYDEGNVTNCNFTDNSARNGGAVYFNGNGDVTNCNFTNNSARNGGAVYFNGNGDVTNCNFADNQATGDYSYGGAIYFLNNGNVAKCNFKGNSALNDAGAIYFEGSGTVTDCNFSNNIAGYGGAIDFEGSGTVTDCNFTNNAAGYCGGAIYFYDEGNVTNCNFAGNNATIGSAIYFRGNSATKTVSNSIFLNNRANAGALDVVKNDYNITITFTGKNNLLNAIYSRNNAEVTFTNVTYWGANGIANTGSSPTTPSRSNKVAGQNITVGVVVNGNLVLSNVTVTDENGTIVLNINDGENYYITVRHDADSYYTEAEKTISNMTFTVNVTSQTTTNKTVNITAKSNIFNETIPGKLLFIVPNSDPINAAYAGNGTWWAVYAFDDYDDYQVNATFEGLDNVTVNNATISISKTPTEISISNETIDLFVGDSINSGAALTPAVGNLTFNSNNESVAKVEDDNIIAVGEGSAVITVSFAGSDNYAPAKNKTISVTVNFKDASVSVNNDTLYLLIGDTFTIVATTAPEGLNVIYVPDDSGVYSIDENGVVTALREGEGSILVKVGGDGIYALNSTIVNVTVSKVPTEINVLNDTFVLEVSDEIATGATLTPADAGNLTYSISNSSVVKVENGKIIALAEGNANITVSFEGDKKYLEAENKTIAVTVSKIPTNISVNTDSLDLSVGDEAVIVATLAPADAGNVTFTSSDENIVLIDDEDGNIIAYCNGKGQANITVSFAGNDKYAEAVNKTISVTVRLNNASVTVDRDTLDLKVGETCTINATKHPDTILLDINYTSSNSSVASVDKNGIVTAVGEGTAVITLSVGDDEIYAKNSTIVNVTVSKVPSEITVLNDTLVLAVGDEIDAGATLTPADAGNLTYSISNSSVVKMNDGKIIALAEGKAIITVSFEGDKKYLAAENKTISVTVHLNDASVTADDLTLDVYANATISPVTSPEGLEVEYISGNTSIAEVDANGVVTAYNAGNTTITITTKADGIHAVNSTTVNVTVNKINSSLSVDDTVLDYGESTNINVTCEGAIGITAKLNGEEIIFSGYSVPIPVLNAGNYKLTVTTIPDENYIPVSKTVTVTVLKQNTTFDVEMQDNITFGEKSTVNVKLPDDATGDVAVKVDGTIVDNATVSNGTASLTIPSLNAGNHTVEVIYSGDGNYNPANKTANVTVKKVASKITAKAKTFKTTTKTKKYTITLKDSNGNPIKNVKVYLKVKGKTYTAKTNSKGKATFKITKLTKSGKYNAVVTFKGNDYYEKTTKKVKITVKSAWKTVSRGSKLKTTVKKIQRALKNNGYYLSYKGHYLMVDGIFESCTERSVKEFQKDHGLKVTGKVDYKTAQKLKLVK